MIAVEDTKVMLSDYISFPNTCSPKHKDIQKMQAVANSLAPHVMENDYKVTPCQRYEDMNCGSTSV